jgi:hypothetical protein
MSTDKHSASNVSFDANSRKRVASAYINIIIVTNLTVTYKRGHVIYVRRLAASHVSLNLIAQIPVMFPVWQRE